MIIVTLKKQDRLVWWVRQRTAENQLAALLRGPGKTQMLRAVRRPTLDVVVREFVEEQEMHVASENLEKRWYQAPDST